MGQHLVFYDGNCGLCDLVVQKIIHFDKKKIFDFAPLQGVTSTKLLKSLPENMKSADTLILIENYKDDDENKKYYIMGKGALRIALDLGGFWKVIGIFSWLPSYFYDWLYRIIARNRLRLFSNQSCVLPSLQDKDRFLP